MATSKLIQINQCTRVCATVRGAGAQCIVLLHGGPGLYDYLGGAEFVSDLARDFTVVSYDQRGSSRSPSTGPFTMEAHIEDLGQVLEALSPSPAILLGHSFGAIIALHFAMRRPDRVRQLIMLSPPGLDTSWRGEYEKTVASRMGEPTRRRVQELASMISSAERGSPQWKSIHLDILNCMASTYMDPASGIAPPHLREFDRAVYEEGWNSALAAHADPDWKASLARFNRPVDLIHGASDPIPWSVADRWCELLPDARAHKLDRAGHFPYLEQPERFTSALRTIIFA